eukprot:TRINITY_DN4334_c0_g1_i3.p1 TRINITY_DN4334_c0_g1~~TRINITY_DN4334_c0_g1_i3.p1  ORF type:complete len:504 (+),score=65.46 TRINITY_DN4334_c0_g1_i3:66-1577(+)
MKVWVVSFVFLLLATTTLAGDNVKIAGDDELVMVVGLNRHGDRAPIYPLPGYPESLWPEGYGELSPQGMEQADRLGELYSRYVIRTDRRSRQARREAKRSADKPNLAILTSPWAHEEIYVRSTDVDRTLMTAQSILIGMYGFTGPDVGDHAALPNHAQPIPIHTVNGDEDSLLSGYHDCPRYSVLQSEAESSEAFKKVAKEHEDMFQTMNEAFGVTNVTIDTFNHFQDPIICMHHHNMTLPDAITEDVYERIKELEDFRVSQFYNTGEIGLLAGGNMVLKIRDYFAKAINGTTDLRFVLLSAHDSTVNSLRGALGVHIEENPPYTSHVLFELWKAKNGELKVRMMTAGLPPHDGSEWSEVPFSFPGMPSTGSYLTFVQASTKLVPEDFDWYAACNAGNKGKAGTGTEGESDQEMTTFDKVVFVGLGCIVGAGCVVCIYLFARVMRKRVWHKTVGTMLDPEDGVERQFNQFDRDGEEDDYAQRAKRDQLENESVEMGDVSNMYA